MRASNLFNLGMGPGTETLWYLIHFEPNTSLFTDLNLTTCGVSFMANIADKIDGSDYSGQNGPLDDTLPGAKIYNDFHLCIQQTCMLTNDTTDCSDPAQCHYLATATYNLTPPFNLPQSPPPPRHWQYPQHRPLWHHEDGTYFNIRYPTHP